MEVVCELTDTNKVLWERFSLDGIYLTYGRYKENVLEMDRVSFADMVGNLGSDGRHSVIVDNGKLRLTKVEEIDGDGLLRSIPVDDRVTYEISSRRKTKIVLSIMSFVSGRGCGVRVKDNKIHLVEDSIPNEKLMESIDMRLDGKSISMIADELNFNEDDLREFLEFLVD